MKISVATLCTPNYDCFGKYSLNINEAYCKKRNYVFNAVKEKLSTDRSPVWDKLKVIEQFIDYYDWIFWIDADAVFVNFKIPLEFFIFPILDKDILICDDKFNGGLINTGTMFIRNSKWSKDFLKIWQQKGEEYNMLNKPHYDQTILAKMIKENINDELLHIAIYPGDAFNSYYYQKDFNPNRFIWHLMSYSNDLRAKIFRNLEEQLLKKWIVKM